MSSESILSSERVHRMFLDAMYEKDPEDDSKAIKVNGLTLNIAFDPDRLNPMREELKKMLLELSDDFLESKGGGMSFLKACLDRDKRQWGEHVNIQELVMLGLGSGLVEYCLPREFWKDLPGGMPYITVKDKSW